MKTFTYDKEGIGLAELTWLALNHGVIFSLVLFLINHKVNVLPFIRRVL